ncbi:MAG: ferredoxin [Candidatus Gracilibacteria bacterium]|nr:ferredoxin [Candidatus Peregrinibacteria bacterium]
MKIKIDRNLCIGAAPCVAIAPEVFELDEEGKAIVLDPKGADDETIKLGAEACPTLAVILFDEESGDQIFPKVA